MLATIAKTVFLKNLATPAVTLARAYAVKSDVKVRWVRPEKIPCTMPSRSGDLILYKAPDQTQFISKFDQSEELKAADEMVKNLFTLEQNRRHESTKLYRNVIVEEIKRHDHDLGSYEVYIAKMTANIRTLQEVMIEEPRQVKLKVKLKELIDKRKKYLRILRKWDYKRFEWLIEKLDVVYRPYPESFHMITRKESVKKLADIQCNEIREERLDAYRKELQSQQLGFLEDKIKNLEFIRNEQMECKVPVTVTTQEINDVKKQYSELKKKRAEEAEIEKAQIAKDDYELNL